MMRPDGAVMISRAESPAGEPSAGVATPVTFAFRSVEEADAVMAGARRRLAGEARQTDGWFAGVSAGRAAADVKAEAKGLCYSFEVIHPDLKDAPIIGGRGRGRARRLAALFFYGIILSAAALIGLVVGMELT